jgi:hypothetical protein
MKVFISWSGEKSHQVALLIRKYLKYWIAESVPFVSSEDIHKGNKWFIDISKELSNSNFGIICLTKENINSDWLLFEAGAISKSVEDSHVYTILFDGLKPHDIKGPLSHFQHTIFTKEDFYKLVKDIYTTIEKHLVDINTFDDIFEKFWDEFEKGINTKLLSVSKKEKEYKTRTENDLLIEILELTRYLAKFPNTISESEDKYGEMIFGKKFGQDNVPQKLLAMLKEFAQMKLLTFYQPREPESPLGDAFKLIVEELFQRYNDRLIEELRVWLKIDHPNIRWMASEIIGYYHILELKELLLPLYKNKDFDEAWAEWELNCIWAHSKLDNNYEEMHQFLINTTIEYNQEWLVFAYQQMVRLGHSSSKEFKKVVKEFLMKKNLKQRIKTKAESVLKSIDSYNKVSGS